MTKKFVGLTLCAMLFALSFPAWAQQPKKVPRIGLLAPFSSSDGPRRDAFLQGCASWDMLRGKTLQLSTATQKGS
jgi:hypothetical protein